MKVTVTKPPRGGKVKAVSSKSHAHRVLIAAALADRDTEIACGDVNEDIRATVRCLEALGAKIPYENGVFTVTPLVRPVSSGAHTLDCGESGSTLRFMLPVACALGAGASIAMQARLPRRPLSPLYEELTAHGCKLSAQGSTPLDVSGSLTGGVYRIAGNVSSQFITGLLLALPLLKQDSRIDVTGKLESRPYVDLTLQVLTDFGIEIEEHYGSFIIKGGQQYKSPGKATVEGDWSNAAPWLTLGAVSKQPVTVTGLNPDSKQGDKALIHILHRFGANVETDGSCITVRSGDLQGIDIGVRDIPDLVPMITVVALASEGRSRILSAARLRLKESDRLSVTSQTLSAFGAKIKEMHDSLTIDGGHPLHGSGVDSQNDHRIAMMAAVASSLCEGEVTITQAEAVNKSYPRFFEDFRSLGGEITEEQS
ncbi:MAG: 3-phosphoshikimate 1-carboxyvinyltransferase [Clostridiales bacterium]|nr:3-phosphoshikimate 1-carboxyvinyltransferase [Clostridiales bacterium]